MGLNEVIAAIIQNWNLLVKDALYELERGININSFHGISYLVADPSEEKFFSSHSEISDSLQGKDSPVNSGLLIWGYPG